MRDSVSWSAQAESDLLEACGYLATGSAEVAERFLEAVDSTLDLLRSNPQAGRLRESAAARLAGIRSWLVRGFPSYLVFYRLEAGRVEIVRLLHGARDLPDQVREPEASTAH